MGRRIHAFSSLLCALALCALGAGPASAAPPGPHSAATIARIEHVTGRWLQVFVDSPSMGRIIQVDLLLPANTAAPRPTVYLLQGGRGAYPDQNDWTRDGHAVEFFADKQVNVVLPVGATGSYYTDWQRDDPVLGRQKWETFLTKEVPPLFDAQFGGDGNNAVAGLSMGAQAALIHRRLNDAARTCELVTVTTAFASASQRNLERQGLRVAQLKTLWAARSSVGEQP